MSGAKYQFEFRSYESLTTIRERLRAVEMVGTETEFGEWSFRRVMGKMWLCLTAPEDRAIDVDEAFTSDQVAEVYQESCRADQSFDSVFCGTKDTHAAHDYSNDSFGTERCEGWAPEFEKFSEDELRNMPDGTQVRVENMETWLTREAASGGWVTGKGGFMGHAYLAHEPLEVRRVNETPDVERETPSLWETGPAATVLEEAGALVDGGEREQQYGPPEESFARIAALWSAHLGMAITPAQVAELMILLKLARGSSKRDSLVDMAGYTRILERLLHQ